MPGGSFGKTIDQRQGLFDVYIYGRDSEFSDVRKTVIQSY
jgi:hypothetical protein